SAVSASAAASAAASRGTLGWPNSANDVSSKSWACPAAPLASAAHVGDVRSEAPTTVQSGVPPSARATSRTIRAIGSVLPASMTPIESSAARRTLAMASRGQSSRRVLTTNSAIRAMALMAVDYSPELSPLASPPSCLRHSSIMSRLRLTAPSAVHLALPRGVSARTIFDHFTARLDALVVDATAAEEGGDLHREGDVAVEVLVETVVAAGLVVEQERRGFRLAGAPADGQQAGEIVGIAAARSERFFPAVGDPGKRR